MPVEDSIKLVGNFNQYKGIEFFLNKKRYTIGRSKNSDLVMNEKTISANHAVIEVRPDGVYVMDLESTNGTFVNDSRVKEKKLRTGDQLKFDIYEFRYVNEAEVPRTIVSHSADFHDVPVQERTEVAAEPAVVQAQSVASQEPRPAPKQARPSNFKQEGSLFAAILVAVIISLAIVFIGAFPGIYQGSWQNFNLAQVSRAIMLAIPILYTHVPWLSAGMQWGVGSIVTFVVMVLAALTGGFLTQIIGRRNVFVSAFFFSLIFSLVICVAQIIAVEFKFDMLAMLYSTSLTGQHLNGILVWCIIFGYSFLTTLVLSFLGALTGKR